MLLLLAFATIFLAYSNGANDNFKGVATLYGSKVLSYWRALRWATVTTFAGSLISFFAGQRLLKLFSGRGIVNAPILDVPIFLVCVGLGAALTVMIATWIGMPISTTHSLVGGLVGAGIASGGLISLTAIGKSFFLPLLLGPISAILLTFLLYSILHSVREKLGWERSLCLCIGERQEVVTGFPGLLTIQSSGIAIAVEDEQKCRVVYAGNFIGISARKITDTLHKVSAGAVSLARGWNDAPKIAALWMVVPFLSARTGLLLIAIAMALGGLLHSRKIAKRMSFGITEMNPGQALTGNFVTALLVIGGSIWGFPLSTTHVSCGSIFGIALARRNPKLRTILQILTAWITTLPVAALLSALLWLVLKNS